MEPMCACGDIGVSYSYRRQRRLNGFTMTTAEDYPGCIAIVSMVICVSYYIPRYALLYSTMARYHWLRMF